MTALAVRERQSRAARRFQKDPELYFTNVLGVETLEGYHQRILRVVAENDRTAIKACHDMGKSFLTARIAMWFLNCFPYSKVITTAPTFNQVERILWSEIRAAHGRAKWPLGGKLNMTDWTYNPDWFALGLSPRNEAGSSSEGQGTQSSFQGFHAPHILVIFDEATGIPPNMWVMVEGLLTSAHVKFVAIGNPTSQSSDFFKCFKDKAWAKIGLSCFDSPNLIANGITDKEKLKKEIEVVRNLSDDDALKRMNNYKVTRGYLLTTKWVVQQVMKWGFNHPLTVSKIFGEFPEAGDDTLISLGLVEHSQLRKVTPRPSDRKVIGVDVARFGSDSSILTALHGPLQTGLKKFNKRRLTEIVGEIINMARELGGVDVIVVDETGLGAGVVDGLVEAKSAPETKELLKNTEIRGIQFGASADETKIDGKLTKEAQENKEKYFNMKARLFGLLAEDMADEKEGLCLFEESAYLEELPSIKKKYNSKGQLTIESKDDYKKRTGRDSPDHSDSLALANFGRYDELKIGKITNAFNTTNARPISSGLGSSKKW